MAALEVAVEKLDMADKALGAARTFRDAERAVHAGLGKTG